MQSYLKCLDQKFRIGEISHSVAPEPFDLLQDLCRIIASEWMVLNTYVERELNNIELWFEDVGEKCSMDKLHHLLSRLMTARRRVTKYDSLVTDQIAVCPHIWQYDTPYDHHGLPTVGCPRRKGPVPSGLLDFMHVRDRFSRNKTRIIEAIQVVTSLMSVKENEAVAEQSKLTAQLSTVAVLQRDLAITRTDLAEEQTQRARRQNHLSEKRNMTLNLLTWVTALMFPFTAVASIMAIPNAEAVGPKGKFVWIFWVSSSLLCFVLILGIGTAWSAISRGTQDEEYKALAQKKHTAAAGTKHAAHSTSAETGLKSAVVRIHEC
jgi:hypothetical protein